MIGDAESGHPFFWTSHPSKKDLLPKAMIRLKKIYSSDLQKVLMKIEEMARIELVDEREYQKV